MKTRMWRRLRRAASGQRGITGLETAIILIAFVVVASVFAFTVLTTGIFSSEKGREAVFSGLAEVQGSIELRSSLLAYQGTVDVGGNGGTGDPKAVYKVTMALSTSLGGKAVDLNSPIVATGATCGAASPAAGKYCYEGKEYSTGDKNSTVISYNDADQLRENVHWTVAWVGKNDGDNLLEKGEKGEITVWFHTQKDVSATQTGDLRYINEGTAPDTTDSKHLSTLLQEKDKFTLYIKPSDGAITTIERNVKPGLDPVMDLH